MAMRKSGPLDAMVGVRIRTFRVDRGMSQAMLAERIGVTLQHVQKYERGANRVGASRLSQIASVLGVRVGQLFETPRDESPALDPPVYVRAGPAALRVLRANARTTSPSVAKPVEGVAGRTLEAGATVARLTIAGGGERRKFPSRG